MILSWCFDVLTKILMCHLLTCHRLPITPRQPPTPSDRRIPSNTSSTRGKRNMEVRNGWQVYLPYTFWLLTSHTSFYCFLPGGILLHAPRPQNTPPDPPIPSNTSTTRGKRNMEVLRGREGASQGGESSSCICSLFSASHLRLLVVAVVRTINRLKSQTTRIQTHTQQSTLGDSLLFPRPTRRVSCLYLIFCPASDSDIKFFCCCSEINSAWQSLKIQKVSCTKVNSSTNVQLRQNLHFFILLTTN